MSTDTAASCKCVFTLCCLWIFACFSSSCPYLFDLMKSGAGDPDWWWRNLSRQEGKKNLSQSHSRNHLRLDSRWSVRPYHVGPVDNSGAVSPAAQHFSLEHLGAVAAMTITNKHPNLRSNSWVWSKTGTTGEGLPSKGWWDHLQKMYGLLTVMENLKPFIMGALFDLLRCPSLWTSEDGISRSSSIFSWGITPELFMVLKLFALRCRMGLGLHRLHLPLLSLHLVSSAQHALK